MEVKLAKEPKVPSSKFTKGSVELEEDKDDVGEGDWVGSLFGEHDPTR